MPYLLFEHAAKIAPKEIETYFVDKGIDPTGMGEPTFPPIFGTLSNAIYQASGERLYHQPFMTKNRELIG